MADGGQVERSVVVSACGEHRAIVQSRCHGLTGIHMHTYKMGDDYASRLLASPFSLAIIKVPRCREGQKCQTSRKIQAPDDSGQEVAYLGAHQASICISHL